MSEVQHRHVYELHAAAGHTLWHRNGAGIGTDRRDGSELAGWHGISQDDAWRGVGFAVRLWADLHSGSTVTWGRGIKTDCWKSRVHSFVSMV
jgi:hypothetical protein